MLGKQFNFIFKLFPEQCAKSSRFLSQMFLNKAMKMKNQNKLMNANYCYFSSDSEKNEEESGGKAKTKKQERINIVSHPKDVTKLVFDENGSCKIYEYMSGEMNIKRLARYITALTCVNSLLFGMEVSTPIFGNLNLFSFGITTFIGYFMLSVLQILSRRTVHRIYLNNDFETIRIQFFNAFWKTQTIRFNISEFQQPVESFFGFTRFELTSVGKIWIEIGKNEFKNVKDYEDTLDYVLLGKPLTNLNMLKNKKDRQK